MITSAPWKVFGSHGLVDQPKKVVPAFTTAWPRLAGDKKLGKCIIRIEATRKIWIHMSKLREGWSTFCADSTLPDPPPPFMPGNCPAGPSDFENGLWQLNHYRIQSKKWFMKVKSKRGDATTKSSRLADMRTVNYFAENDKNDILDEHLAKKKMQK